MSYREGFSFGVLSFTTVAALGVVSGIVVARVYGIDVIGRFALASAPVGALWFLSSAREQAGLVRELTPLAPRAPGVMGRFAPVFAFSLALTVVAAALTALVAWPLYAGPIGEPGLLRPALVLIASYALVSNTSWNLDVVFAVFRAGRELFWVRLGVAVAYVVVAVALAYWSTSIWSLVAATVASGAVGLVHRLVLVRRYMTLRTPRRELREGLARLPGVLRFGIRMTPGPIADGIAAQAGVWVLGAMTSVSAVGGFNRAQLLGNRLNELGLRVGEMLFPTVVERSAAGDRAGADRALIDSTRYLAAALLLAASVGGGASAGVMRLYGPGFPAAADALTLLLLLPVLTGVAGVQSLALAAEDRPGTASLVAVARLTVVAALTIALTSAMGITGAALAIVAGYAGSIVVLHVLGRRHLSTPLSTGWPPREAGALVGAYVCGFVVSRLLDRLVAWPAGLVAALTLGALAFAAGLAGFGGLNTRDRARLRAVRRGREVPSAGDMPEPP